MSRLFVILMAVFCGARGAEPSGEQPLLATVQKLFDSMAAHDADAARAVLVPEGRVIGISESRTTNISQEEFAARLATTKASAYLERIWNPRVLIRGSIANVWADYDFHLNQKFSHCGIDSFSLIKDGPAWKIAGIVYTVETSGCKPQPVM